MMDMETVAFRFSDGYAPKEGTINLHKEIIKEKGCVWYGVFGVKLSDKNINKIINNEGKKIILVKSKTLECYVAEVIDISKDAPNDTSLIPSYYRNDTTRVKTWIKIKDIIETDKTILEKAVIQSTGKKLIESINGGMTSFFIIEIE